MITVRAEVRGLIMQRLMRQTTLYWVTAGKVWLYLPEAINWVGIKDSETSSPEPCSKMYLNSKMYPRQWVHRQVTNKHAQKVLSGQTEVKSSWQRRQEVQEGTECRASVWEANPELELQGLKFIQWVSWSSMQTSCDGYRATHSTSPLFDLKCGILIW